MRDIHHPASLLALDLEEVLILFGRWEDNIIVDSSYHSGLQHATKLSFAFTMQEQVHPLSKFSLPVLFQLIPR